jgi:outer membrane lipoprotein-sorting protein
LALVLGGCASMPPAPEPLSPEASSARTLLEQRWKEFRNLRTLAEIRVRRGDRVQRLAGVLLLRAPSSLRFEALSPFGTPVLVVAGDEKSLTVWEVPDERAYILPASPDANRRWLGLALGPDELVATLCGRVLPLKDPLAVHLLPADGAGTSLALRGKDVAQRIWFDPATGQASAVEWTGGADPVRVVFADGAPDSTPAGMTLTTLDGKLEVAVKYQDPRMNIDFDPGLLRLTVPEHVRIQDFR